MTNTAWQTHWHKHPGVRSGDDLTLGERAADKMRSVMGSWPFVFGFFAVMIAWAVANSGFYLGGKDGSHGFDPAWRTPVQCTAGTGGCQRRIPTGAAA
jgi:hypothetical protein